MELDPYLTTPLRPKYTGLPANIWFLTGLPHPSPRVGVQMDHSNEFDLDNVAFISVEDDPPQLLDGNLSADDLDAVRRYVVLNRRAILDHWHGVTTAPGWRARCSR